MGRATVMERMLLENQKKFGAGSCYVAPDHASTHYGVPVDNLAMQYLLSSTVLPLERIIELSGPFGSGKSSIGYWVLGLVAAQGGFGSLVETENKSSASLMGSILGPELAPLVRMHRAKSMEDGQDRITNELKTYQKVCPEKNLPMAIMLDSLVGNRAEETVARITKDGHADRAFSKEALIISPYFSSLSDKLIGWPIVFLYTNHEKQVVSDGPVYGSTIRNPGGSAPDFHNTYHIRVVKTETFKTKLEPGFTMKLVTKKSSMGADHRSIFVDMRWRFVEDAGSVRQVTTLDWDKATAELLEGEEVPHSLINDVVQVTKVTEAKYNCPTLKLREAPPSEVGKAIQASPDILRQLRTILGIFTWRPFVGTEEEKEKPAKARKKAEDPAKEPA